MDRRLSLLDWLTMAIAVDLALSQFLAVPHDLDPIEHSRPLIHWYGFPLVWLAGPEPADLFSRPIRNWAIPALVVDMACLVVAPLAVRHSVTWMVRKDSVTLGFNMRGLLGGVACYSMMCAVWLNPRWCFLCDSWTCKFVINRGLLSSAIYLPLVLPAILFSSIGLAVLVELSLARMWKAWHRRRRTRFRPDAADLFAGYAPLPGASGD